jgi:hypothetical protein
MLQRRNTFLTIPRLPCSLQNCCVDPKGGATIAEVLKVDKTITTIE